MCDKQINNPEQHQSLAEKIINAMGHPRHKFTILIGGVDAAGKTSLGRFLAFRIGLPLIETDLFIENKPEEVISYREGDLRRVVEARHKHDRGVIIEGVCILRLASRLGISPDYLVHVKKKNHFGSQKFQELFASYESQYGHVNPDFSFHWSEGG